MSDSTIVFIHIGPHPPAYLGIALRQARLFNPNIRLILLASNPEALTPAISEDRHLNLEIVTTGSLTASSAHRVFLEHTSLDRSFRNGFWLYTSERFFFLEELMRIHHLTNVFHLENDNLLYSDLIRMLPIFKAHYPGIAATCDAPDRCVPGFVFINQAAALSAFADFAAETVCQQSENRYNDMTLLGAFHRTHGPATIDLLPIITPGYPEPLGSRLGCRPVNPEIYSRHFDDFNSLFDAAAIGQYLGGIDPANSQSRETSGFINETSIFNPSLYEYRWSRDAQNRRVPVIIEQENIYKINNLHIHSKKLEFFASFNISHSQKTASCKNGMAK